MWAFFQSIDVLDATGRPGPNFGHPDQVYLRFRQRLGDRRAAHEILAEGRRRMEQVRSRGIDLTEGHGEHTWDLQPALHRRLRILYTDARTWLWSEPPGGFEPGVGSALTIQTLCRNREDYILHPPSGEEMTASSHAPLARLAAS